jgi:hypothetical protein
MKRRKSQRRWVRHAGTPKVKIGGSYYNPCLQISVAPCGRPEQSVTFELDGWQWRELCSNVREVAEAMAKRFESMAQAHASVFQLPAPARKEAA